MEDELISVIVPVYKVEKYLKKCIDSIIGQTYKNLEIILIDDGSPDNCGKICDEYAKLDNRIKVVHKKNGGVSSARNFGLEIANGNYIGFVDPDDYINSTMYEELINEYKNNSELDIVLCGINDIDENENIIRSSVINCNMILNKEKFLKEILDEKKVNGVVWNKLFKRNIIQNTKFNTEIKIAEDLDFIINILDRINNVKVIQNRLYNRLVRKDSVTSTKFNDNWKQEINICKNIIYLTENKYKKIKNYAIKRYIRVNITCYKKILDFDKNNKELKKYIRKNISQYIWKYEFRCKVKLKSKIIAILICLKMI